MTEAHPAHSTAGASRDDEVAKLTFATMALLTGSGGRRWIGSVRPGTGRRWAE
jgi:hypothetical protein